MGYNPKQEEAYVRYQRVAETQASNYFSDQEIDAAHIPPPWMIQRIEQLRREQGRRNERDILRIEVPLYDPCGRPDDRVPEQPERQYNSPRMGLEQIL